MGRTLALLAPAIDLEILCCPDGEGDVRRDRSVEGARRGGLLAAVRPDVAGGDQAALGAA
jgi:hypothetical protein